MLIYDPFALESRVNILTMNRARNLMRSSLNTSLNKVDLLNGKLNLLIADLNILRLMHRRCVTCQEHKNLI
ncbi:hypothetical protein X777_08492 [Ooceraea biroi]|uniref:Uncharacterized protein n=1 Tax=Ooceraea biroi TaxID=2015173 RepID=A0A026W9J2_OOCBI|nr:hypothetical protein X777_08492 [Ooceraea biroi]